MRGVKDKLRVCCDEHETWKLIKQRRDTGIPELSLLSPHHSLPMTMSSAPWCALHFTHYTLHITSVSRTQELCSLSPLAAPHLKLSNKTDLIARVPGSQAVSGCGPDLICNKFHPMRGPGWRAPCPGLIQLTPGQIWEYGNWSIICIPSTENRNLLANARMTFSLSEML